MACSNKVYVFRPIVLEGKAYFYKVILAYGTGIITGLLAKGYKQEEACKLGMYLHGLAGDLAVKDLGKESLIASDIIKYLPQAFLRLED